MLGPELRFAYVNCRKTGDLLFGKERFSDERPAAFMGFHDWLRRSNERKDLAGVRFWPLERSSALARAIHERPYLEPWGNDGQGVAVWFQSDKTYDPAISGDQSFGLNRVLCTAGGDLLALVLDTDGVSEEEMRSIGQYVKCEATEWIEC